MQAALRSAKTSVTSDDTKYTETTEHLNDFVNEWETLTETPDKALKSLEKDLRDTSRSLAVTLP